MSAIHALDCEQSILGAVIVSPKLLAAAEGLSAHHFYDPTHAALWSELQERYRSDRLIDVLALKSFGETTFAGLGGATYIMRLSSLAAVSARQVAGHAQTVREAARRRAVVDAAKGAIATAQAGDRDALVDLEYMLQQIAHDHADADAWQLKGQAVIDAIERAELGEAKGLSTGFSRLDEMTGGLRAGLYCLGAAPSMGKSTLLAAIARNVASQGYGVAEFMLEMDSTEDGLRTATALAFNPSHRADNAKYLNARRGELKSEQWEGLRQAAKASARLNIYTDWRPGRTVRQIEAAARRLFRKMERDGVTPGLLVIDHEGLIHPEPGERYGSDLERARARADGLLRLHKVLGVPVLVAGQLTKEGKRADGEDRMPSSDDWKFGGYLMEAADCVILVHRKAYYAERKPLHLRSPEDEDALRSRETTLVIDKCRGGRRGQTQIMMDMATAAVWEESR